MTHLTPTYVALSRLAGSVRIASRRISLLWRVLPSWVRAVLTGVSMFVCVGLLLVGVLLVF